jgi:hypothetical protein
MLPWGSKLTQKKRENYCKQRNQSYGVNMGLVWGGGFLRAFSLLCALLTHRPPRCGTVLVPSLHPNSLHWPCTASGIHPQQWLGARREPPPLATALTAVQGAPTTMEVSKLQSLWPAGVPFSDYVLYPEASTAVINHGKFCRGQSTLRVRWKVGLAWIFFAVIITS